MWKNTFRFRNNIFFNGPAAPLLCKISKKGGHVVQDQVHWPSSNENPELELPLKDLKHYLNASQLTQFVSNFEWKRRKLAKKFQQNHANLVRNYLSFNRLKHAMFYLSSFFLFQWNWYCVRSRCQDPYIQYIPVLHGILTEWS